ncbi:MAG TPA: medium chain dehydrogenase/reductase family protein [Trebonia sp.]|jgi:NADPH:quinone reductase-like Zn-dependent oxidoreductase|nr:medium chain dehydrogenase/reductase family protein [Trebonia sp.]
MQSLEVVAVTKAPGPDSLQLKPTAIADPPAGHARVRVEAAGVSYGDLLFQRGVVPGGPKPPFTPGCDLTGVVESAGAGVTSVRPGDRVTALVVSGGYSTVANVPAERLVKVPDGLDPVRVAAVTLNYFIAYQMLHRVARVTSGQRILVHGASGGVGLAFLQLAAQIGGVTAWGTTSAANFDIVKDNGATPIDYRAGDFSRVVRAAGGHLDAVFDHIGGTQFLKSYSVLRRGGILVAYGQNAALRNGRPDMLAGAVGFLGGIAAPKLLPDGRRTMFYNAWLLEKTEPEAYRTDLTAVLALLAQGKIAPKSVATMPIAQASKAFQLLEDGVSGKLVLDCAQAA